MMERTNIRPVIVTYIPSITDMKEGELYISQQYSTAAHLCCCGCGEEIVTPLNPAKWSVILNNGVVSLRPSIGNWSYQCKSHYFITKNKVVWAGDYSAREIQLTQERDQMAVNRLLRERQYQKQPIGLLETFARWVKSSLDKFFR